MGNTIVAAVGATFVEQVQTATPPDAEALLREFRQVSGQLRSELRGPLAKWSSERLAADPNTEWMARVLRSESASPKTSSVQTTLEEIKQANDGLKDKARKGTGRLYSFSRGDNESVELPQVESALEKGPLTLHVLEYVKDTPGRFIASLFLGGEQGWLNGVAVKSFRHAASIEVEDPAALSAAFARAKLAE
jgi:hypothetical protein